MIFLSTILGAIAAILCLPVTILLAEVLCALMAKRIGRTVQLQRPAGLRVAVLVPAHDEEDGIGATVSGIAKQLGPSDRLVVVADNCTDRTAEQGAGRRG